MGSNVDLRDQINNPEIKNTLGELFSGKKGYVVKETIIKHCKNCRKLVKDTDKFCPECGVNTKEEIKKNCLNCKKQLKGNEKFCTECGNKI
jgi:RNA polymerase subunit RPABC4/transcription elongation factor Spt4